jgi:hypothetical protein
MSSHIAVTKDFYMSASSVRDNQTLSVDYLEIPFERHARVGWVQVPYPNLKNLMSAAKELKDSMDELLVFNQTPGAFKKGHFESKLYPRCRKAGDELESIYEKCMFG